MGVRRVLVTGASGFTGRYVMEALRSAGFTPLALVADLCDEKALRTEIFSVKPDAVIHLAGIAYVGHENPADFYRINLLGTLHLLQTVEAVGTISGSVVLASSANIYGNVYQTGAINELFLPHPLNDYAVSKLAMEEMASLWNGRLPITIVRPFNYTGVGQSLNFVIPKIIDVFIRKEPDLMLGNIDVCRDFTDVRDVARWYVEILKSRISGEILNFCSGEAVSLRDIVHLCEKYSGHTVKIKSYSGLKRKNDLIRLCGDRSKLIRLLGKAAVPTFSLCETLQWMLGISKNIKFHQS